MSELNETDDFKPNYWPEVRIYEGFIAKPENQSAGKWLKKAAKNLVHRAPQGEEEKSKETPLGRSRSQVDLVLLKGPYFYYFYLIFAGFAINPS